MTFLTLFVQTRRNSLPRAELDSNQWAKEKFVRQGHGTSIPGGVQQQDNSVLIQDHYRIFRQLHYFARMSQTMRMWISPWFSTGSSGRLHLILQQRVVLIPDKSIHC